MVNGMPLNTKVMFLSHSLQAAWMLLAGMSLFTNAIELKFLLDNWHQYSSSVGTTTASPLIQILVVIGNMASSLSKMAMEDMKEKIVSLLSSFQLSTSIIQAAVNALCQVGRREFIFEARTACLLVFLSLSLCVCVHADL